MITAQVQYDRKYLLLVLLCLPANTAVLAGGWKLCLALLGSVWSIQCLTVCHSILQYNIMQYIALYYSILHYTTVYCGVVQYIIVCHIHKVDHSMVYYKPCLIQYMAL